MEIPKKSYACANCHQRFNNPTILIKHVELRHSIAKQSQNGVRNTEPEEINASVESQDPLENTHPTIVPFEFSRPIGNNMEVDPQEIEVPIKDKHEEINNQEFKSEKNKQNDDMEKYTTSIHEGKKVFICNIESVHPSLGVEGWGGWGRVYRVSNIHKNRKSTQHSN